MQRRYRVLYVEQNTDGTIGGSYYSLLGLVSGLNKDKFEAVVCFYQEHGLIARYEAAGADVYILDPPRSVDYRRLADRKFKMPWLGYPLLPLQRVVNFFKRMLLPAVRYFVFLRKNKIDLVHLNNSILYNHAWMLACRLAKIPCITHERGINNRFPLTARYFGRKLDAIISISGAVTDNFARHGIEYPNIITIYNGIDPDSLKVKNSSGQIRLTYGITGTAPVIGVVGNVKPWKGQEFVIRAASLVRNHFPDLKCLIVGAISDNSYADKLHGLVKELNLSDNIVFTGYQEHVPDFMNVMDVVIHSSIDPEPFGRVLLEGMGLGKAVIATNFGAPPEIIQDGQSGYLVAPEDPDVLAECIVALLSDEKQRQVTGNAARKRVLDDFTMQKSTEKVEKLYLSVLSGIKQKAATQ